MKGCGELVVAALLLLLGLTGRAEALDEPPVAWPPEEVAPGAWRVYLEGGLPIMDKVGQPDCSRGAVPSGDQDICGGELTPPRPSAYHAFDAVHGVFFYRIRVAGMPLRSPSTGDGSGNRPFNGGTWNLIIDSDQDGFKEFTIVLDGNSGGSSSDINPSGDDLKIYYNDLDTQCVTPEVILNGAVVSPNDLVWHSNAATQAASVPPRRDADGATWDYGRTRHVFHTASNPQWGAGYFVDFQFPLSALTDSYNAGKGGTPRVLPSTPVAFGYTTANSNSNPLQKDLASNRCMSPGCHTRMRFGDVLAMSCGDGIQQAGEECDDGNLGDCDGCSASCRVERCGNGVAECAEACDTGGESATCDADCTLPQCGDGVVNQAAGEECDTGGETATCDADCTRPVCGDGVVNTLAGEECDDGNVVSGDGCSATCQNEGTPACGDGILQAGEACDDGNRNDCDGCTGGCQLEMCGDGVVSCLEECDEGRETAGCDGDCTRPLCGDGIVNAAAGEECDDGNTRSGDGCSELCRNEVPPVCGDGILQAGEECDDGNRVPGDGCSAVCTIEPCRVASLNRVAPLFGVRGTPLWVADFEWWPSAGATAYHLNSVEVARELRNPTRSNPAVQAECTVLVPLRSCSDVDAPTVGHRFYQVLAACAGSPEEGPF